MVSSRILKRRKRAQVGTLLAVLLILLPLPAGAYLYGQMTDLQDQSVVFTMDGTPDDPIFDQSSVEYDNVTDTYTYSKYDDSDVLINNFTSDLNVITFAYANSTNDLSDVGSDGLSYSESSDKIFTMLEQSPGDGDSTLTFSDTNTNGDFAPNIGFVTAVSPKDMLDSNVDTVRVYWENNQELNLTYIVGYVPHDISSLNRAGVSGVTTSTPSDSEVIVSQELTTTANGTWTDIEIPETELLTAATAQPDGYVFITFHDTDGGALEETSGILAGVEMIGSEDSPISMSGIWQAALVAIGLFGLVGAIIATPYMSIEGLTGDGMQGQRYKKGYNPRKKYNKRRK
jgi:hypothetical protein